MRLESVEGSQGEREQRDLTAPPMSAVRRFRGSFLFTRFRVDDGLSLSANKGSFFGFSTPSKTVLLMGAKHYGTGERNWARPFSPHPGPTDGTLGVGAYVTTRQEQGMRNPRP